jgi:hypothetical protein
LHAQVAARLQDKLKERGGKKGEQKGVDFDEEDIKAFEELKKWLCPIFNPTMCKPRYTFCVTS